MERIYISKCLNRPVRIMGSSFFGVIGGGVAMFLMWILFSMPIGIISFVGGYTVSVGHLGLSGIRGDGRGGFTGIYRLPG
jgi:hypothetical protein